ncbi:FecR/PupR family sigma factor regulator [Henriciella sp.]|uniref:FecR/PupR family sigma factor regulator n=1 Tax=Henriciella sp. TaxID=1968823 RepID=UPI0026AE5C2A
MATRSDDHTERLRAAARWYAQLTEPHLSEETWQTFQAWEVNPANAAAFREIERSLAVLDRTGLGKWGRGEGASAWAARWRAGSVWLSGIAAVLVLGVVVAIASEKGVDESDRGHAGAHEQCHRDHRAGRQAGQPHAVATGAGAASPPLR